MRDLCCARCARVVIADFWTMVSDETEPTFSAIRLTCTCGARIKVDLQRRREARPLPALAHPTLHSSGLSSISAA